MSTGMIEAEERKDSFDCWERREDAWERFERRDEASLRREEDSDFLREAALDEGAGEVMVADTMGWRR